MKKRIHLLILCLLMLAVSFCLLTSCKKEKPSDDDNAGDGGTSEGGTTEDGTGTEGDTGGKAENISFKTLTVNETDVTGSFSNEISEFSFSNEIVAPEGLTYTVSTDEEGTQAVNAYNTPLAEGDNVFYVRVKPKNDKLITYKVTLYRTPVYTVTLSGNGGSITGDGSYVIGNEVTATATVDLLGYEFLGWYKGETLLSAEPEYTFNIDGDTVALFDVKAEMKNFFFTSTDTECIITGIKDSKSTTVFIPEYVTEIADSAFMHCSSLKAVTFAENSQISKIGNSAFLNCHELAGVVIPDSVTSIGENAFFNCHGLTSVTVGSGVNDIGASAFYNCYKLVEVINKSTLSINKGNADNTYIGNYALVIHNGESLVENKDGYLFYTDSGVNYLLGYAGTESAITLPANYNDQSYKINNYAFYYNNSIVSVVISDNATAIGDHAFANCDALTGITLSDGVESIGNSAFYSCSSLNSVDFSKCTKLLTVGHGAFSACVKLADVKIPNCVTTIAPYAFYNCTALKKAEIPQSVQTIGDSAFYNCYTLTSLILNNGVQSIGSSAFYNCAGLTSITVPETVTEIGKYAFAYTTALTELKFNAEQCADLLSNNYVFYISGKNSTGIKVTFGEAVKKIPAYLFYPNTPLYAPNISETVIGKKVEIIGDHAFDYCSTLKKVTFTTDDTLLHDLIVGKYAFSNCTALTDISIPNNTKTVSDFAFTNCTALKTVTFTDKSKLSSFGSDVFNNCTALTSISVPFIGASSDATGYKSHLGYLFGFTSSDSATDGYHYSDTLYYTYNIPSSLKTVNLTAGETVGSYVFGNCVNLNKITLPKSVKTINDYAFSGCTALQTVTFADKIELTSIPTHAFENCTGLTSITIPDNVTTIGEKAFFGLTSLKTVKIGNGITEIGASTFENCTALTTVTFGSKVATIGAKAFYNCPALKTVTIPNTVKNIEESAFENCTGLTTVTIGTGITSIGVSVFKNCTSLTTVNIVNNITEIGASAFENCTHLTTVTIGTGLKTVGAKAFYNCHALTSIVFPNNVTSIAESAFENCIGLTSATIGTGVTEIGNKAFYNCQKLVEVINKSTLTVTKGVEDGHYLGYYAFEIHNADKSKIVNKNGFLFFTYGDINYLLGNSGTGTSLNLPADYEGKDYVIYKYAFYGKDNLTSVVISSKVTSIGENAFSGCNALSSITVPYVGASKDATGHKAHLGYLFGYTSSANATDGYHYYDNNLYYTYNIPSSLKTVTVTGETSIGDHAFSNCADITDITVESGITSININAFNGCVGLTSINVSSDNTVYMSIDGNLYSKDGKKLIKYAIAKDASSFTVPDGVEIIGNSAFEGCVNLTEIVIPESVNTIEANAFRACSGLKTIKYNGTLAQWKAISKGDNWDYGTDKYTVSDIIHG